jgi:mannose-1-phosphate guanylyltransferase
MDNHYAIIMAGGVGSRFWPLSRNAKPKQFLDILGTGETLLQQTFNRCKKVCDPDNIIVVTNADHKALVMDQIDIRSERVLSEPYRRNTAPCIAYGTYTIQRENPDAVILITPADHIITNEDVFNQVILNGFGFVSDKDALLTIGIKPDKPDTGYGYINADMVTPFDREKNLFKVVAFTEKPQRSVAESFIKSGSYFWNAGIFMWKASSILKAFERYLPDISVPFSHGLSLLGSPAEEEFIRKIFFNFPNISIDYGILEKATNVFVIGADPGWSDLGTWGSLYGHSETDPQKNAIIGGKAFSPNSNRNLVSLPENKVALIEGLEDYIVVDTKDALLIIRKQEEQKIKEYLESIKPIGKEII